MLRSGLFAHVGDEALKTSLTVLAVAPAGTSSDPAGTVPFEAFVIPD
jgi:hypothetical protein